MLSALSECYTLTMSEPEKSLPSVLQDDGEFPPLQEVSRYYSPSRLDTVKPKVGRANVAVQDTFDMIGGTPRFAHWAHTHPTEFYTKIYTRTLQTQNHQEHSGVIEIRSAIPRTTLDGEFEDVTESKALDEPEND